MKNPYLWGYKKHIEASTMTARLISLANSSTPTHQESNILLLYGVIICLLP